MILTVNDELNSKRRYTRVLRRISQNWYICTYVMYISYSDSESTFELNVQYWEIWLMS